MSRTAASIALPRRDSGPSLMGDRQKRDCVIKDLGTLNSQHKKHCFFLEFERLFHGECF
jgi:hypothetical protein